MQTFDVNINDRVLFNSNRGVGEVGQIVALGNTYLAIDINGTGKRCEVTTRDSVTFVIERNAFPSKVSRDINGASLIQRVLAVVFHNKFLAY